MPTPTFLQLHTLTSYPGTLLNRDDAGFAKRLPFGGATRTRVSSQCLKYHWRNHDGEHALYRIDFDALDESFAELDEEPKSFRSRETFRRLIARPLLEKGHPARLVIPFAKQIQERVLSDGKLTKTQFKNLLNHEVEDDEDGTETDPTAELRKALLEELDTGQVTIFGAPEVRYMRDLVRRKIEPLRDALGALWDDAHAELDADQVDHAYEALKSISKGDLKKNLKGLQLASGLDAALFGRMATSDVLARGDAAIHVAHAFTTHEEESESDYFSAVDQLVTDEGEGELGSGHINSQELTSGLFYGYVVVDLPLLVSNLEGVERSAWQEADKTLAKEVLRRLVYLVSTVSPGAKLGSTAPHAYAQCLLGESSTAQPRTLANAFESPVSKAGQSIFEKSCEQLGTYVEGMDGMYGWDGDRRLAAMNGINGLAGEVGVDERSTVAELADWAARQLPDTHTNEAA